MKTNWASRTVGCLMLLFAGTAGICRGDNTQAGRAIPYKSIPPREEAVIERTAVVIYRHIAQARADIHRKEPERARRELNEAERLVETMKDFLSTSVAQDLIRIAGKHLEYEAPREVLRDFPPILASLDRISPYIPVDKAQLHIDRAREFLGKNDRKGADRELALAQRSLLVTEVELPLFRAEKFLGEARYHLAANETRQADRALQKGEQQAQAIFLIINSPLHLAEKELWQANQAYSDGRLDEAGTHLRQARVNLEKAAASGHTGQQQEISLLSSEANDLESRLANQKNVAAAEVKSIWEKGKALSERMAEYLAAGWEKEETTLGGENALIEAKLHVAYAETYQLTTGESKKAAEELGKADSYLHRALQSTLVDKKTTARINELSKEIATLKARPTGSNAAAPETYEAIKGSLDELINEI